MKREDVLRLVRPNILALEPYSTARDEYEGGEIDVWLDANENPFDNGVNRYPDPHQVALKGQLAEIKGVDAGSIFIGNGSDEAIDLVFRIFARPGVDNAISIAPTYGMYKVSAATNDVSMREVELGTDFSLPVDALLAAADENSKIMWICSPNNPTGNSFPMEEITRLIEEFRGVVIVDEAYIDFAAGEGFLPELAKYENLIVLQTLSKAWGMAGLRFGLAFASEAIISLMNRVKYPYNINVLTQAHVARALEVDITEQVETIIAQRRFVIEQLEGYATVERVYPTDANFVLVKVADADKMYNELVEAGVIVRNRTKIVGCKNTLRLTIGTEVENERMLRIIKNFGA
ncbi:MAG: histidinol-phosphate transaminase [Rikenellaceae bacterium]